MKSTGWESRSSVVLNSVLSALFKGGEVGPELPFFPKPEREGELSICCQATIPSTDLMWFDYISLALQSSAEHYLIF